MRLAFLFFGLLTSACMLLDVEEDGHQEAPGADLNVSCTDLWKHYTDELQLINDDDANWAAHDDNAVRVLSQFSGSCNVADAREASAAELRCKALWSFYMKETGRMTKDDRLWREHDLQQVEAMNRIRNSCNNTACKFVPGV